MAKETPVTYTYSKEFTRETFAKAKREILNDLNGYNAMVDIYTEAVLVSFEDKPDKEEHENGTAGLGFKVSMAISPSSGKTYKFTMKLEFVHSCGFEREFFKLIKDHAVL